MSYWWVSQKQTYRHEVTGGYLWSPKRGATGNVVRSYELMRSVLPGDIVFSYAGGFIKAVGVVSSICYGYPKPTEFGNAGGNWNEAGWRVDVNYVEVSSPFRPRDHWDVLQSLLPDKYSPLQQNSNGNQAYLFDISFEFAAALARIIDNATFDLVTGVKEYYQPDVDSIKININKWEDSIEKTIAVDQSITDTDRETLIKSRRGQGKFRAKLFELEPYCRVTKVNKSTHLIASHTKPWSQSSNVERLDPENGFMLTPTVDHLYDSGLISFENNGDIIISETAHVDSIIKMGLENMLIMNVGGFTDGQKSYLDWHRNNKLL